MTEHDVTSAPPADRHLLLVDDEENILSSLRRLLRRDGYIIHTASSGEDGLAVLEREPVGVIISDQRMPGMSGSEFLSKVKARFPDTMRIVLSGYTELNSIAEAINRGAIYKFLTKPWDDDLLREHVAEAFTRFDMKQENQRLAALNQAMIDAIPDALFLVDAGRGTVINANAAASALLGYAPEAFRGMSVSEFEPLPQDQLYWEELACGPFRPMQSVHTEYLTGHGEWIPIRKSTSSAAVGNQRNVLVLAHDFTRERQMESSLERINAEMASIFEATSEGLLVIDSRLQLSRLNRHLKEMWSIPDEVLVSGLGLEILRWIASQSTDPGATLAVFTAHLADPELRSSGTFVCREGSTSRWVANPQRLGDEIIGHVISFSMTHAPVIWANTGRQ